MGRSVAPVPVARPGRRAHRKVITRGELLRAGRKLFSEKGLYESRVEDLTTTAGIAKGTLYRYFRDKEHLIQAVVADGFASLQAQVDERTAACASRDERLLAIAAAHLDFFSGNPDLMRVFHQARGMLKFDRRGRQPLRQALRGHLRFLAQRIEPAGGRNPWRAAVRWDAAVLMFGAVSGVTSVAIASRAPLRLRSAALPGAIAAMAHSFAEVHGRSSGLAPVRREPGRSHGAVAAARRGGAQWNP